MTNNAQTRKPRRSIDQSNSRRKTLRKPRSNPSSSSTGGAPPVYGIPTGGMLRTMKNLARKADHFGEIPYVVFYYTVLSRLAYFYDKGFVKAYANIFGSIITTEKMKFICEGLVKKPKNMMNDTSYTEETNDVAKVINPAIKRIENHILYPASKKLKPGPGKDNAKEEAKEKKKGKKSKGRKSKGGADGEATEEGEVEDEDDSASECKPKPLDDGDVKYISIAWSRYGSIYLVTDKRCPNLVNVLFRGLSSPQTAIMILRPQSIFPTKLMSPGTKTKGKVYGSTEDKFGVLYGCHKTAATMIHTVMESMAYLVTAQDFKGMSRVVFTGHSIGGALATSMSYLFYEAMHTPTYKDYPFFKQPVCISISAPRMFDKGASDRYCDLVRNHEVYYKRYITRGDPVMMMPMNYHHPCEGELKSAKMTGDDDTLVSSFSNLNCNNTINVSGSAWNIAKNASSQTANMLTSVFRKNKSPKTSRAIDRVDIMYDKKDLDCLKELPRLYTPNPIHHGIALNIAFVSVIDLKQFMGDAWKSLKNKATKNKEPTIDIMRDGKEQVGRIIYGEFKTTPNPGACLPMFMTCSFFKLIDLMHREDMEAHEKERDAIDANVEEHKGKPLSPEKIAESQQQHKDSNMSANEDDENGNKNKEGGADQLPLGENAEALKKKDEVEGDPERTLPPGKRVTELNKQAEKDAAELEAEAAKMIGERPVPVWKEKITPYKVTPQDLYMTSALLLKLTTPTDVDQGGCAVVLKDEHFSKTQQAPVSHDHAVDERKDFAKNYEAFSKYVKDMKSSTEHTELKNFKTSIYGYIVNEKRSPTTYPKSKFSAGDKNTYEKNKKIMKALYDAKKNKGNLKAIKGVASKVGDAAKIGGLLLLSPFVILAGRSYKYDETASKTDKSKNSKNEKQETKGGRRSRKKRDSKSTASKPKTRKARQVKSKGVQMCPPGTKMHK